MNGSTETTPAAWAREQAEYFGKESGAWALGIRNLGSVQPLLAYRQARLAAHFGRLALGQTTPDLEGLIEEWRVLVNQMGPRLEGSAFEQCANQLQARLEAAPPAPVAAPRQEPDHLAELEAFRRWTAGEQMGASRGIHEGPTYGYGTLDYNGYFEFPLPAAFADRIAELRASASPLTVLEDVIPENGQDPVRPPPMPEMTNDTQLLKAVVIGWDARDYDQFRDAIAQARSALGFVLSPDDPESAESGLEADDFKAALDERAALLSREPTADPTADPTATLRRRLAQLPRYRIEGRYGGLIQTTLDPRADWIRWDELMRVVGPTPEART